VETLLEIGRIPFGLLGVPAEIRDAGADAIVDMPNDLVDEVVRRTAQSRVPYRAVLLNTTPLSR
jgi:hypothetical protein